MSDLEPFGTWSVLVAWSESTEIEPQRHINKIEAVVPAICLCTWPDLIRGSLWLHFIDNDGALACLISGCSENSSLSAVVDFTWAQIPALSCWPWFERVPSECNIVDGLSRRDFSTAQDNNWVRDSAQLPEPLLDLAPAQLSLLDERAQLFYSVVISQEIPHLFSVMLENWSLRASACARVKLGFFSKKFVSAC